MSGKPAWGRFAAEFRGAHTPRGRARSGYVALEGVRVVERALRAGAVIEQALVSEEFVREGPDAARRERLVDELARSGTVLVRAPRSVLEELCGGRDLGHLTALARALQPVDLAAVCAAERVFVLVLCDVEEPGNVGALVRTALAAGAQACMAVGCSDPWHPKAVRTSMGSVFRLPLGWRATAAELLDELAPLGIATLAAVSSGGTPLDRVRTTVEVGPRRALFLGSEAFGLDTGVRARLDLDVTIPMPANVDSFSVNAAAAILCWELAPR